MIVGADTVYRRLIEVAERQDVVNYSDIAPLVKLQMDSPADRNRMANILDNISSAEHRAGRPLLSAVVIRKDKNMPGNGFFKLARGLGLHTEDDDFMYWLQELRRVHDYWT